MKLAIIQRLYKVVFSCLLVALSGSLFAQQPPCGENNPPPGNTCEEAPLICNLDGYCGQTSSDYTVDIWGNAGSFFNAGTGLLGGFTAGTGNAGCGSGATIENNSFLKFVAESASVNIDLWIGNCTNASWMSGIQVHIFKLDDICSQGNVTNIYCKKQFSPTGANAETISLTSLVPGETYYIMIDGFEGDVCDYTFTVDSGVAIGMSVEVSPTTVCPGEEVTASVSGGSGDYEWSGDGLNTTTGASVTITAPQNPGTYDYTVTSAGSGGCSNNDGEETFSITVTSGETPTFTNPGPVCGGQTFTLPTTSDNGVNGTWSPAINTTETTEYTFTPDAAEECATETSLTVEVSGEVTPTFTNPGPVCGGQTFTLPTTSDNGINGTWSPAINTTATTEYTFTPDAAEECAIETTLTVEVASEITPAFTNPGPVCTEEAFILPTTSNNGINGTWSPAINTTETTEYTFTPDAAEECATETTLTVIIQEVATPDFTELSAMCEGDNFALPTTSNNNINGTWSPAINNLQTTTYTFTPSEACAEEVTMTVEISQAPNTPIVNTTPADCDNPSVSIITNFNPSADYVFDPPGPTVGENGEILGMNEGINYTVASIDGNCQSGKTDPFSLTIIGQPNAVFNGTAEGCLPVTVQFQNNSTDALTYLWEFGDGQTSINANPSHVYTQEGCFDVTLTVTNEEGCTSTAVVPDYICAYPSPVAGFSASTEVIENIGEEVYFNNHSTGASSFLWSFGDGDYSTETHPSHSYTGNYPGNYPVILIATNEAGCTDTAKTFIEVPENITFYIPNSFTPDGDVNNPEFLPLFSPDMIVNEYEMQVYNRWGELIFETYDPNIGWDGTYMTKETEMCKDGIYIWKMQLKMITTDKVIYKTGHVSLIR